VSAIKIGSQKRLVIVSGRAHIELAAQVAAELDTDLVHTDARTFANGEIYARFDESVAVRTCSSSSRTPSRSTSG
jgi:Phosphoribosylpyrophosphate synthetase